MASRDARAGQNEALFREVNERIEEVAETFEAQGLETLCECDDRDCTSTLQITMTEYRTVRSRGNRFLLTPGHEDLRVEGVVERNERFLVVEKTGEAADVARELDPRD